MPHTTYEPETVVQPTRYVPSQMEAAYLQARAIAEGLVIERVGTANVMVEGLVIVGKHIMQEAVSLDLDRQKMAQMAGDPRTEQTLNRIFEHTLGEAFKVQSAMYYNLAD